MIFGGSYDTILGRVVGHYTVALPSLTNPSSPSVSQPPALNADPHSTQPPNAE